MNFMSRKTDIIVIFPIILLICMVFFIKSYMEHEVMNKINIPYKAERMAGFSDPGRGFAAERIKVIGGWIVRHVAWDNIKETLSESSVFVPDADYKWTINEESKA
jgi:hypothetical protein